MIVFRCPACGESFEGDPVAPGVKFHCSQCKTPMIPILQTVKEKKKPHWSRHPPLIIIAVASAGFLTLTGYVAAIGGFRNEFGGLAAFGPIPTLAIWCCFVYLVAYIIGFIIGCFDK